MPGSGKSKVVVKTEDEDERFVSLRGVLDTKSGEVGIAFSAKDEAIFNAFKASIKLLQNSDRSRKLLNFKKEGMARDAEARWVTSFYKTTDVLTDLPAAAIAILRRAFNGNKLVVSYSFTDTNGKGLSDSDISKCNAKIAKALKAAAEAEEEGGTDPGEDDDSDDASSTAGSTAAAARAAHTYTEEVEQVLGEQNEFLGEQFAILEDSIHKAVAREIAPAVQAIPSVTKEVKALATKLDAFGKVSTAIQKELAILQAGLGPLPSAGGSASSSSSSSSSASPSKEVPSGVAAEGGSKEAKSLTPSKRAAAASPASASRPVRNGRAAAAKPSM